MVTVGDPTLTRYKTNLQYISGGNSHLISQFCEDELGLNSLPNMVSNSMLTRFVGSIVSPTIQTIWKRLRELFKYKSSFNKAFLIRKLENLKYKDGFYVEKHLSSFN